MTKSEIIKFEGSSEDLLQDSDDYFAMRAYETQGDAIRDNPYQEWVAIGKRIKSEGDLND
jgi:hypothetical protein